MRYLYDVVERIYERLLGGIDTLNNVLLSIVAANVAVVVLFLDKITIVGYLPAVAAEELVAEMALDPVRTLASRIQETNRFIELSRVDQGVKIFYIRMACFLLATSVVFAGIAEARRPGGANMPYPPGSSNVTFDNYWRPVILRIRI